MSLFYWIIAIVVFLVGFLAYCLCAISSRCSRQEEAMERKLKISKAETEARAYEAGFKEGLSQFDKIG